MRVVTLKFAPRFDEPIRIWKYEKPQFNRNYNGLSGYKRKNNFTGRELPMAHVYIKQAENSDKPGGKVVINNEVNISGKLDVYANLEIGKPGLLIF
ncbi:MAG: hypothetical protein U5K79_08330 [Cyclobacteriaceae bacterium]|nr:hypothetical protein [Cyclobacteriaceae bacterium]